MKKLTPEELTQILENHKHWIYEDCDGWENMRANLQWANLLEADLREADLREADLQWADLRGANLRGANLQWADLREADLRGAKNIPFIPLSCPDTGAFIGWKKAMGRIVKLQIPEDAKRSSATTTKCRCDKALVLAIENPDGTPSAETSVRSLSYAGATYNVGEMVYPDSFDEDRWNECSHGIHFFINRQEAVEW